MTETLMMPLIKVLENAFDKHVLISDEKKTVMKTMILLLRTGQWIQCHEKFSSRELICHARTWMIYCMEHNRVDPVVLCKIN